MSEKQLRLLKVRRSDSDESVHVKSPREVLEYLDMLPHGVSLTVKAVTMGERTYSKLDGFVNW